MDKVIIREAEFSDLPYFYEICLKTGASGKDATSFFADPYLLGQYYAAPYLFFEKDLCFVSELEGTPQGYIIAASDTLRFHQWLENEWIPPLRRRYPPDAPTKSDMEKRIVSLLYKKNEPSAETPFYREYPAHLHIDLCPALQGKGQGKALMEVLFNALAKKSGKIGVHLGVDTLNTGAIGFYKKLGFSILKEEEWGFVMGNIVC
jgi:ribosomal protein S18 acetylase RimI-like enzyme